LLGPACEQKCEKDVKAMTNLCVINTRLLSESSILGVQNQMQHEIETRKTDRLRYLTEGQQFGTKIAKMLNQPDG